MCFENQAGGGAVIQTAPKSIDVKMVLIFLFPCLHSAYNLTQERENDFFHLVGKDY